MSQTRCSICDRKVDLRNENYVDFGSIHYNVVGCLAQVCYQCIIELFETHYGIDEKATMG